MENFHLGQELQLTNVVESPLQAVTIEKGKWVHMTLFSQEKE